MMMILFEDKIIIINLIRNVTMYVEYYDERM